MKRIFLIAFGIFANLYTFAQISSLKIEKPAEQNRVILPYDSLTNITRNNLPSLVGQKIQILPYIPAGGSDLATGPTLYNTKPGELFNDDKVVNPDKRFTIYKSKFGSFTNQVFDIIGADSVFSKDFRTYRPVHFYLIVKNENYTTPHYLEIGLTNDEYDYNKNLKKRGSLYASSEFVILGYFEKLRANSIGKKFVMNNARNTSLGGSKILYNLSDGEPLVSVPENTVLTLKDLTLIDSNNYKGLAYVFSSDSIPDTFSDLYLKNFEDYDKFIVAKQKKKDWEREMIRKYGKSNGQLIIDSRVKIGFTKKMCEESWGYPKDINKSTGSWGVHEQWVYGAGSYLYFENGKLTSIQN